MSCETYSRLCGCTAAFELRCDDSGQTLCRRSVTALMCWLYPLLEPPPVPQAKLHISWELMPPPL